LIVSNLALAQRGLGTRAHDVQMLAVTVDPRRDTPRAIQVFLAARGALGRMDYYSAATRNCCGRGRPGTSR